jgi:hypothetical protein
VVSSVGKPGERGARLDVQVAQREEDLKAAVAARSETNALLAEMRSDIKTLLRDHLK